MKSLPRDVSVRQVSKHFDS